jgi:hypothetical protein
MYRARTALEDAMMQRLLLIVAVAGSAAMMITDAPAQAKKAKTSAKPACLNALACGPQPVPKIRKPKSEKFMKSAS